MIHALAAAIATVAAAAAAPSGPADAPRAWRVVSASAGIEEALAGLTTGVVAFGELHQTKATAEIPSALRRFTQDVLPGLSGRLSQLVVETWVTTGKCGEVERAVTADVERTTERPAQTETEIETLIRVADQRGVAPHILSIACSDYQAMLGGGGVDYDRTLKVTARALREAILRALSAARAPSTRAGLIAVYGGALHNDRDPEPELAAYSFAREIRAATLGQYVEIDLVVPEYAAGSAAQRAQPWWRAYLRERRPGATVLVRRASGSFMVIFPTTSGKSRR